MDPNRTPPNASRTQPPLLGSGEPEPVYPPDSPFPMAPATDAPAAPDGRRGTRLWAWVAALVLAAGAATAVALLAGGSSAGRGAESAEGAAHRFVSALNSSDKQAAADISCTGFQDQARSEAASGADPAISFHLDAVTHDGDTAQARISQTFELPDGTPPQVQPIALDVIRTDGRWLVCGTR